MRSFLALVLAALLGTTAVHAQQPQQMTAHGEEAAVRATIEALFAAAERGDLAWAIFGYDLRAEMADRQIDVVGRGTAILEKQNGRWVIRHTHTSGRPRRPTDG